MRNYIVIAAALGVPSSAMADQSTGTEVNLNSPPYADLVARDS